MHASTPRLLPVATCVLALTLVGACAPSGLDDDGDDRDDDTGEGEGEGEGEGGTAPGGACACDADCAAVDGHAGTCVFGVCFLEASGACGAEGSTAECADGSRCWDVAEGFPVCWPDCSSFSCAGTCDADGSCAPTDATASACDNTCSSACDSGGGGGGGGGPVDLGAPPPAPTTTCSDIPSFECVPGGTLAEIEAHCGALVTFDPRQGDGYDDYAINGETASDQYRSFARRDVVAMVKYATAATRCISAGWDFGNPTLGLGDMSEADGSIPGTSIGEPGHPEGSHLRGYDMDIAYYQLGQANNRLREVCPHVENGEDQYHCTGAPTSLDVWRTTVFIAKLMDNESMYLSVGVDGRIGPILEDAAEVLCDEGILSGNACGPGGLQLSYDTDPAQDIGWYYFHHHHLHYTIRDKLGGILPNW